MKNEMNNKMKNKNVKAFKTVVALTLVFVMTILTFTSCSSKKTTEEESTTESESSSYQTTDMNFTDTTKTVKKSETVYVNLKNDGTLKKVTVSDWLHTDKAQVAITDKTSLDNFSVTKGQASVVKTNGDITWQMDTTDVYYQGTSDKDLPVDVTYTYNLDGKDMTASEIAGKSGKLTMTIKLKNKVKKDVKIDGKTVTIYTPIVAVGGMILSYDNFSDINVQNGLSVGGGSNEIVVLAGAPGLNESLNLSALDLEEFKDFSFPDTFTITATVKDFQLSDTYFAVIPITSLNMDIKLPKTIDDVKDVLLQVNDLQSALDTIDPNNTLSTFLTDGTSLTEMMSMVNKAMGVYEDNKELLSAFSQYLTTDNIQKLSKLSETLNSEDTKQLMNLLSNVPQLKTVMSTLTSLSSELSDVMPMLEGISSALDDPKVAAELEKLPETMATLSELTSYLEKNKDVLNVFSKLMSSDDLKGLTDSLDNLLSDSTTASSSSGTTSAESATAAKELVARMNEWLKFDYRIFTEAPDYMSTSCMFIYKTDPVK